MTSTEIKAMVLQAIHRIAPEADPDQLDPDVPFRDQIDFDSVDFVTLMEQLQAALDRRIPEIDYPQLTTLNGCLAYLG
ncbi:MAG: acyl carrier protein [Desulfoprunum sp.]|jgi:acyl carrier protein|uniref:acyl carrier protein n=1 Tax=Desulfoprunum sp. TaxID=2020866 RepID=UPI00052C96B1|nr:acyl carrier protein [Desulfobulbus sp. Tol-SR]